MTTWIVNCDARQYDLAGACAALARMTMPLLQGAQLGDYVYLYQSEPVAGLTYLTQVTAASRAERLPGEERFVRVPQEGPYTELAFQLDLNPMELTYGVLRDHGLKSRLKKPQQLAPAMVRFLKAAALEEALEQLLEFRVMTAKPVGVKAAGMRTDEIYRPSRLDVHKRAFETRLKGLAKLFFTKGSGVDGDLVELDLTGSVVTGMITHGLKDAPLNLLDVDGKPYTRAAFLRKIKALRLYEWPSQKVTAHDQGKADWLLQLKYKDGTATILYSGGYTSTRRLRSFLKLIGYTQPAGAQTKV